MNPDVTLAVARLQARLAKTSNAYRAEVYEVALIHLLDKPNSAGPPGGLIAVAIAAALMKLGRRQRIFERYAEELRAAPRLTDTEGELRVAIADAISKLPPPQQRVLTLVWVNGGDIDGLADELGQSADYWRQTLSRARAAARVIWMRAA